MLAPTLKVNIQHISCILYSVDIKLKCYGVMKCWYSWRLAVWAYNETYHTALLIFCSLSIELN